GRTVWGAFRNLWAEPAPEAPPADATTVVAAVLAVDRPALVVVLLGVNDLDRDRAHRGPALADETVGRLVAVERAAAGVVPRVLVATLLANRRDPPELIARVNDGIRARWPDALPLGDRFAAAGGAELLGDEIHPSEAGHEVLAGIVADELARRGLVLRAA